MYMPIVAKLSETAAMPCIPRQEDKAQVKRAPR